MKGNMAAGCVSTVMDEESQEEVAYAPILQHHILRLILEQMDPGSAMKFAATCKCVFEAVKGNADGYWRTRCTLSGWISKDNTDTACPQSSWFVYYCARMATRWRIRRFLKLYIPFMSRANQMNLNTGANPEAISEAEQRLGASFPWQVWELYRFRNGQAPSSGVQFFEDVRLLMLSELTRERVYVSGQYGLARTQAIEQAISRISTSDMPQGVPAAISAARVEGSVEDVAGMGVGRDVDAVKILEASSGARSFLVDLETGCVLQKRGLSTFIVSISLSTFLQRLLT